MLILLLFQIFGNLIGCVHALNCKDNFLKHCLTSIRMHAHTHTHTHTHTRKVSLLVSTSKKSLEANDVITSSIFSYHLVVFFPDPPRTDSIKQNIISRGVCGGSSNHTRLHTIAIHPLNQFR